MLPISCRRCKAFFPNHLSRCPSCGFKRSTWPTVMRVLFAFVLAALIVWAVDQLPSGIGPDRPAAPRRTPPPPSETPAARSRAVSLLVEPEAKFAIGARTLQI